MMAERKFCPKNLWAVILTAIRVEYRVVRAHLSELEEVRHPQGTVSEQGHTNQPGGVTAELEVEPQQRGLTRGLDASRAHRGFPIPVGHLPRSGGVT